MKPLAFDVSTAAKMTGLSPHTIRQYIRRGILKVTRCGRRVLLGRHVGNVGSGGVPSNQRASGSEEGYDNR